MTQRLHQISHIAPILVACGAILLPASSSASYSWTFTSCGSLSGSGFGNSLTCIGTPTAGETATIKTTLTGWSSTDNGGGYLETGQLNAFSGGYGLTNRDAESSYGGSGQDPGEGPTPEHAFDSDGRIDAALLTFKDNANNNIAVQLTTIFNGWPDMDSDITVYYYKGDDNAANSPASAWNTGANPTPDNPSYAQLVDKGWAMVGHYADGDTYNIGAQTAGITSSYWLISAYNSGISSSCYKADGTGTSTACTNGTTFDYFKLKNASANYTAPPPPPPGVPEPGSLALLGLGSLLLMRARAKS